MRVLAVAFIALSVSTLGVFPQPASGEPVAYTAVIAAEASNVETPATTNGSDEAALADALTAEQAEHMAGDPDWRASARLYHAGGGGATGNDSLGSSGSACQRPQ